MLVGEMVDAATQYLSACDASVGDEDAGMIGLAYSQIAPLTGRVLRLSKRLEELEKRLKHRLAQEPGSPPPHSRRRIARAGS